MKSRYGGVSYLSIHENTQKDIYSNPQCHSSILNHFFCTRQVLKNRGTLKGFDIFLDFEKNGSFKKLTFSWFHCKKGYFFPKDFLKRGQILHARTHMCTHFSYNSHHQDCSPLKALHSTWFDNDTCNLWNEAPAGEQAVVILAS